MLFFFCSDSVEMLCVASRLARSYMRRYGRWLGDFIQSSLPPCELPAFPWIASGPLLGSCLRSIGSKTLRYSRWICTLRQTSLCRRADIVDPGRANYELRCLASHGQEVVYNGIHEIDDEW